MSTLSDNESRDVQTAKQRSSHNLAHANDYASDIRTDLSEAAYDTRVCNGPCKAVFRLKLTNEFSNCDHVYCDDCIDKVTSGGPIDATYCPECVLKNISEEALATCVEETSGRSSGKISSGGELGTERSSIATCCSSCCSITCCSSCCSWTSSRLSDTSISSSVDGTNP